VKVLEDSIEYGMYDCGCKLMKRILINKDVDGYPTDQDISSDDYDSDTKSDKSIKDDVIKKAFNIYAPEEYYYYTFIKILNLEDEIITTPNVSNDATTFTNWEGTKYKYPSTKENKNYTSISSDELEYLLNSECLFGRKFNRECMRSLCNKKYIDTISGKQQKLAS
jgi:hypothetical protein